MTKQEKLLAHATNNPHGLTFAEFQTLLRQSGWVLDHQKGSHQIWYSPDGKRLPIQEGRNGKAIQAVEKFLLAALLQKVQTLTYEEIRFGLELFFAPCQQVF